MNIPTYDPMFIVHVQVWELAITTYSRKRFLAPSNTFDIVQRSVGPTFEKSSHQHDRYNFQCLQQSLGGKEQIVERPKSREQGAYPVFFAAI